MLDSGRHASMSEMAAAERIDGATLGRDLRLALRAADIAEAILDGRQSPGLELPALMQRFPLEWDEQRMALSPWAVSRCLPDGGPEGTVGRVRPTY